MGDPPGQTLLWNRVQGGIEWMSWKGTENRRCWGGPATLRIVLLLLCTRPVDLADMGGCVACLWLLVVAALVEDLRQVGSVDLPELLIIIQSSTEVPVFTCGTKQRPKLSRGN